MRFPNTRFSVGQKSAP